MAENQKSSTQQAAEAVVNRLNAGAPRATTSSLGPGAQSPATSAGGQPPAASNNAVVLPKSVTQNAGKR
jgi:hypothetical protein